MKELIGLLFGVALLIMGVKVDTIRAQRIEAATPASATVEVLIGDQGHGSGVHLGNGYVLTAGHVAQSGAKLVVEDTQGTKRDAEVLWTNTTYDVALLRVQDWANLKQRNLACRALIKGEQVSFEGNPLVIQDVTTWGRVAQPTPQEIGPWKQGVLVDAQIMPGMSGGPVFDAAGAVIGINVGTFTGYAAGIIVPSQTVCSLLAK